MKNSRYTPQDRSIRESTVSHQRNLWVHHSGHRQILDEQMIAFMYPRNVKVNRLPGLSHMPCMCVRGPILAVHMVLLTIQYRSPPHSLHVNVCSPARIGLDGEQSLHLLVAFLVLYPVVEDLDIVFQEREPVSHASDDIAC